MVVDNEESPTAIADKINICMKNKDKVMKLYKEWKQENDRNSKMSADEFIKFGMEEQ